MHKKGFTIVEVLITLTIIGVVAALVLPSFLSNTQDKEFTTARGRSVYLIREAIRNIRIRNGGFINTASDINAFVYQLQEQLCRINCMKIKVQGGKH